MDARNGPSPPFPPPPPPLSHFFTRNESAAAVFDSPSQKSQILQPQRVRLCVRKPPLPLSFAILVAVEHHVAVVVAAVVAEPVLGHNQQLVKQDEIIDENEGALRINEAAVSSATRRTSMRGKTPLPRRAPAPPASVRVTLNGLAKK